ncbi:zf-U1-domain-containing protein [Hyphopichia burtonii NRRL Y-1933]|uniref:Zf-U1-domain-containing protein n=1 Tax=Hyphopichia burtonii NRRL Y-1933 TaxID=984485 RepID=A0A1E4RDY6_9ASCO|nr:zf-U1-domain-containing protein [Hyphopichia burtonii NRRL Y-1933]ODV65460.1 zf-U1-domain-containing protein [Hyphopichia burtonii NRRL Y-1933]
MPKYYCDYCRSYLTHDTMSVRKSHLQGRNHIRYYCQYYEAKAKETNEWKPSTFKYQVTLEKLNEKVPGPSQKEEEEDSEDEYYLPPPPNLSEMPNPPASAYRYNEEYNKGVNKYEIQETII